MTKTMTKNNSDNKIKNLGDYIRIVKPSVWIVIAAAVLLIGGLIVWGFFGKIYFTMDVDMAYVDGRGEVAITDLKTIYDAGTDTNDLQVIIDKQFYNLEDFEASFIEDYDTIVATAYVADYVMSEDTINTVQLVYKQASPISLLFD